MKIFRFEAGGHQKPGVILRNEERIDVSSFIKDYDQNFFAGDSLFLLPDWVEHNAARCPTVDSTLRLAPCVASPSKIVCVGLNYARHAAEAVMEVPREPVIFLKAPSSLCGANDDLVIPRGSEKTDWEVELAVVISKRCRYVSEPEAMRFVAGYCMHNDYSERTFQFERGGQWVKGKSCDTFGPLGPFLATRDEIKDPDHLHLWLKVNGQTQQDSSTSDLIFRIAFLISYISEFMTLLPGDVISTGTPEGVGFGQKPPRYLREGDVVEFGIDGLGTATQRVVAYSNKKT